VIGHWEVWYQYHAHHLIQASEMENMGKNGNFILPYKGNPFGDRLRYHFVFVQKKETIIWMSIKSI
jgi:hypothetical protein